MKIIDARRDKTPAFAVSNQDGTINVHLILAGEAISVRHVQVREKTQAYAPGGRGDKR